MGYSKLKTPIGVLQEYVPYYLAKYVMWYMTPEDKRIPWEELCTCDLNYKSKEPGQKYKTEKFAEENWLPRQDVQEALQAYTKYFKRQNLAMLYQNMLKKAMDGDTKAADWIVKFSESEFFKDDYDEANDFLSGIHLPGLEKK